MQPPPPNPPFLEPPPSLKPHVPPTVEPPPPQRAVLVASWEFFLLAPKRIDHDIYQSTNGSIDALVLVWRGGGRIWLRGPADGSGVKL